MKNDKILEFHVQGAVIKGKFIKNNGDMITIEITEARRKRRIGQIEQFPIDCMQNKLVAKYISKEDLKKQIEAEIVATNVRGVINPTPTTADLHDNINADVDKHDLKVDWNKTKTVNWDGLKHSLVKMDGESDEDFGKMALRHIARAYKIPIHELTDFQKKQLIYDVIGIESNGEKTVTGEQITAMHEKFIKSLDEIAQPPIQPPRRIAKLTKINISVNWRRFIGWAAVLLILPFACAVITKGIGAELLIGIQIGCITDLTILVCVGLRTLALWGFKKAD